MEIIIFGGGMMGEAIAFDLFNHSDYFINFVENSSHRIKFLKNRFSKFNDKFSIHALDITNDISSITELLKKSELAFGAIDYKFNLELTKLCIKTKTHFLDLGGNNSVVNKQHELNNLAKNSQVIIVPDCGLAPGMANIIASGIISLFDSVNSCHIRVGGLPQSPKGILKYQQVFSIRGLTNEYIEESVILKNAKITKVPSLTEVEKLQFKDPIGELEAFHTSGGSSSLPNLFQNKINDLNYKTIRYPGHAKFFQFLQEYELLSEQKINEFTYREIIEKQLSKLLPKNTPDLVIVRIIVEGLIRDKPTKHQWELIDYMDEVNQITSMGRTTAYPISIIAQMILEKNITKYGVLFGEVDVPFDIFLSEMKKRNMDFDIIISD